MNWPFSSNRDKDRTAIAVRQLTMEMQRTQEQIAQIISGQSERENREKQMQEQLHKLTRIQYKAGQEVQLKWEQLLGALDSIHKWQHDFNTKDQNRAFLMNQNEQLLNALVLQLDEIDLALASLRSGNDAWGNLLNQWAQRIISSLKEADVFEIEVLGKTFDPHLAEGMGVIDRADSYLAENSGDISHISYEVADVIKRGFTDASGRVLRKAQVITYKEPEEAVE